MDRGSEKFVPTSNSPSPPGLLITSLPMEMDDKIITNNTNDTPDNGHNNNDHHAEKSLASKKSAIVKPVSSSNKEIQKQSSNSFFEKPDTRTVIKQQKDGNVNREAKINSEPVAKMDAIMKEESKEEQEDHDVAPILSRKTKKKKIQSPKFNKVTKSVHVESESESLSVATSDHDTPISNVVNSLEVGTNPKSVNDDDTFDSEKKMMSIVDEVIANGPNIVADFQEINFDGKLDQRVERTSDVAQIKHILNTIRRVSYPSCSLAQCLDMGENSIPSGLNIKIINSASFALFCANKICCLVIKGLEARISYIRQHHGRNKTKKLVAEWAPLLDEAKTISKTCLNGLDSVYKFGAEKISEQDVNLTKIEELNSIENDKKVLPPTTVTTVNALSVEQYLDELLTAIYDFVYVPQVQASSGSSEIPLDPSVVKDQARIKSWITLAAATGLDPQNFDVCQQIELIRSLQINFPSPRELVALIIENPTDPRLLFDSLQKEKPPKVSIADLESKIAQLQNQLHESRVRERQLELQLNNIKTRNDTWRPGVLSLLGLTFMINGDDAVEDDLDDDWIDDD